MKYLLLLGLTLAAAGAAFGQYNPVSEGVAVDPATGALKRPMNFFGANRALILLAIGETNFGIAPDALLIRPTVSNGTVAGTLTIAPGAMIVGRLISIEGDPSTLASSNAVPRSYVDQLVNLTYGALERRDTLYVTNLAQLRARTELLLDAYRPVEVLEDTGTDKSKGLWMWNPHLVAGESDEVLRPTILGALDPGRYVKRNPTNATLWGLTTVPPGSSLYADQIILTGNPGTLTPSNAVPLGLLDQVSSVIYAYINERSMRVVDNLAQLTSLTGMSTTAYQLALVRNSTAGDGSAGEWLWDPNSLAAESHVIKKLSYRSIEQPGRFFQR